MHKTSIIINGNFKNESLSQNSLKIKPCFRLPHVPGFIQLKLFRRQTSNRKNMVGCQSLLNEVKWSLTFRIRLAKNDRRRGCRNFPLCLGSHSILYTVNGIVNHEKGYLSELFKICSLQSFLNISRNVCMCITDERLCEWYLHKHVSLNLWKKAIF